MAANPSYRDWCFTLHEIAVPGAIDCSAKASVDALWAHAAALQASYLVVQLERAPETGRLHFQGYFVFKKAKRLTACKSVHPTAHWEHRMGTHEQVPGYYHLCLL